MSNWKPIRAALMGLFVWAVVSSGTAFGQDAEADAARAQAAAAAAEAARQAEANRQAAEQDRIARERSTQSMQDLMTDSRTVIASANAEAGRRRERQLQAENEQLIEAFHVFQAGSSDFAEALSLKAKLRNPARKIEKSSAVFIDFIRRHTKERASFNPSEFKDFTATQLQWETLTTAENLAPLLGAVLVGANSVTIDIRFVQVLPKVEAELLRLQWMTKKVK